MMICAKCNTQLSDDALYCSKCGSMITVAPALQSRNEGITSFVINASAGVGEFERVSYACGKLTYERDSATMPNVKMKKKVPFRGRSYDALCEYIRGSCIDAWPLWDLHQPEPVGKSFPCIEIRFSNGAKLYWRNRYIPQSSPWRQVEKELSNALGLTFCIEGWKSLLQ